jgi:hypothetical protein
LCGVRPERPVGRLPPKKSIPNPYRFGRDDLMLYTITTDGTIRVFCPVLDQPNYLQLHGALDAYSSLPLSFHPSSSKGLSPSAGFVLDREVMCVAFTKVLEDCDKTNDDSGIHRLRGVLDEGWDLFLHVHEDRSLVVGAIAVRAFLFPCKPSG